MKTKKLSNVEVVIREDWSIGGYAVYLFMEKNGKRYLAETNEFSFKEVGDEAMLLPSPTFQFSTKLDARVFLQDFSNELNNQGMKPNNDAVHGELKATKVHLDDMRKIVFDK